MYKNTNCFHLAIPCGDLEIAKKFYSETLGCRLDNSAQEWADVDFWGNELTLHKSCLLYTSPSPRDMSASRMPSSA